MFVVQVRAGHLGTQEEEQFLRQANLLIEKVKKIPPGAKKPQVVGLLEDLPPTKPSLVSPPPDEPKKLHPPQDGGANKHPLDEGARQYKTSPERVSLDVEDPAVPKPAVEAAKVVHVVFREEVITIPDTQGEGELSGVVPEQGRSEVPSTTTAGEQQQQQCPVERVSHCLFKSVPHPFRIR